MNMNPFKTRNLNHKHQTCDAASIIFKACGFSSLIHIFVFGFDISLFEKFKTPESYTSSNSDVIRAAISFDKVFFFHLEMCLFI
jgi:hypothetical protein